MNNFTFKDKKLGEYDFNIDQFTFVPTQTSNCIIHAALKVIDKPGNILDTENNIIGRHKGIENYTVGQRKHINVNMNEPLYVIKILADENSIIVGEKEKLGSKEVFIESLNWLGPKHSKLNYDNLNIKVRARQKTVKGSLTVLENFTGKVLLENETSSVAKGQGCVFYNNEDQLLGGGWIK